MQNDNLPNLVNADSISDNEKEWCGPFTFVQAADTQLGLIDRYLLNIDNFKWEKEKALCRESIRRINAMEPKPKFYIICGDMLDAFPYEGQSTATRKKQYADFVDIFKTLDPEIRLLCVCGNHDIGDIPTPEAAKLYRSQFGQDYFAFCYGGVLFVVLNSQYFMCPDAMPDETAKQLEFIDKLALINPKPKHIVIFQHIPFFLQHPDEGNFDYFNIEKELRLQLLDKLYNLGARYIFCGHYHGNCGGFYKDMEQVVTTAIGAPLHNDPSGFRIVNVFDDRLSHEFVPFFASLSQQKDNNFMPL
ncbi:Serine/threonine-protein phosphatase CPPED1 [Pseudolycoriella hygida]|uniref:Serine/threonine-protein phosphatase CPPED1 n=1 Tax=Pseudolycoriella hygida TaxID=35572 RepID=A0A9Q0RX76_9DIPT|nr:Serine/threonine-protein phosphatase CPPED1 [Pseudolycoriella hygida]